MTTSLYLSSITNAIASISVSGVTVKDVDEISPSWTGTPNILYPNPNAPGFITNFEIDFDSMLQGESAPTTLRYTLNYRFLGTAIGDMGTFTVAYSNIITKVTAIYNALIAVPAPYDGRITMTPRIVDIGAKEDPAGNQFHGADFALSIEELQN